MCEYICIFVLTCVGCFFIIQYVYTFYNFIFLLKHFLTVNRNPNLFLHKNEEVKKAMPAKRQKKGEGGGGGGGKKTIKMSENIYFISSFNLFLPLYLHTFIEANKKP